MTFNVKKFFTMLIVAVLSIGLVAVSGVLINPQINQKQDREALSLVKQVHSGATKVTRLKENQIYGVDITLNAIVFENDLVAGYAYLARTTNGYGYIELLIYAQNNQINQIKITDMVQTMFQDQTIAEITKNIGTRLDVAVVDVISGPTSSRATIEQMIQAVATTHQQNTSGSEPTPTPEPQPVPEPEDIYKTWFGEGFEITDTQNDLNDAVSKKVTIGDRGFVYRVSMSGEAMNGSEAKKIEMIVAIDTTGKVLGYQFEVYEHTTSYQAIVVTYLENNVLGKLLSEIPDVPAGSTGDMSHAGNSTRLVMQMLHKVKEAANL